MWFKSRYVELLEKRIEQFEFERVQLINENKKLVDRLLEAHGFKAVHSERSTQQVIKEAEEIAGVAMSLFEDLEQPEPDTNKLERYDG